MKIIAKSADGQEHLYNARSAHKVSARSGEKIAAILNEKRYRLGEGEVWHIHDVDRYDKAYQYAETQSFVIRGGYLARKAAYNALPW